MNFIYPFFLFFLFLSQTLSGTDTDNDSGKYQYFNVAVGFSKLVGKNKATTDEGDPMGNTRTIYSYETALSYMGKYHYFAITTKQSPEQEMLNSHTYLNGERIEGDVIFTGYIYAFTYAHKNYFSEHFFIAPMYSLIDYYESSNYNYYGENSGIGHGSSSHVALLALDLLWGYELTGKDYLYLRHNVIAVAPNFLGFGPLLPPAANIGGFFTFDNGVSVEPDLTYSYVNWDDLTDYWEYGLKVGYTF